MTAIYLVRHGRTLFNAAGRTQGWCDTPLLPEGVAAAQALGRGLQQAGVRFDKAISADFLRHRQTARLVLDAMGQQELPLFEDAGLREVCFGSWEGEKEDVRDAALLRLTGKTDILEVFRSGLDVLTDALRTIDPSGLAERASDVGLRMEQALLRACRDAKTVLAVSSGLSINCLLARYTDRLGPLPNASVCRLTCEDGRLTVQGVGETPYLEQEA